VGGVLVVAEGIFLKTSYAIPVFTIYQDVILT
jgi:hypothetical protein